MSLRERAAQSNGRTSGEAQGNGFGGEMLKVNDVARLLRVHPNSVRRWANQGLLRAYRVGVRGDRRFSRHEVYRFIASEMPPEGAAQ